MKDWPRSSPTFIGMPIIESTGIPPGEFLFATKAQISEAWEGALSDFTRVVEETGILDQERSQKEKSPSNEGSCTKSGDGE